MTWYTLAISIRKQAIVKNALDSLSNADTQTITPAQTGSNPSPHEFVPSDQGRRQPSRRRNFLRLIRGIVACLLDSSPYQQISRRRECSIVFTSSGPLVYRHRVENPFIPVQSHDKDPH